MKTKNNYSTWLFPAGVWITHNLDICTFSNNTTHLCVWFGEKKGTTESMFLLAVLLGIIENNSILPTKKQHINIHTYIKYVHMFQAHMPIQNHIPRDPNFLRIKKQQQIKCSHSLPTSLARSIPWLVGINLNDLMVFQSLFVNRVDGWMGSMVFLSP